jgi:hypothetical protein
LIVGEIWNFATTMHIFFPTKLLSASNKTRLYLFGLDNYSSSEITFEAFPLGADVALRLLRTHAFNI